MAKSIIKKKKWVQILAPKLFNEQVIGESYVGMADELVGRSVTVSLMALTGEPQRQTTHAAFKIVGVRDGKAVTELYAFKMLPSAAKKLVRRKRSKIADSFIVESKDNKLLRVKPLLTTRGRVSSSVLAALRRMMRAFVATSISKMTAEEFIRSIVQKKYQNMLVKQLKSIHPMGPCIIRHFEYVSAEKAKGALRILPSKNLEIKEETSKEKAKPAEAA